MAASVCAQAEQANGHAEKAQGPIPTLPIAASTASSRTHQPDHPGLGELLRDRTLGAMLRFDQKVGGEEGKKASDASAKEVRLWLETVE